jgi:hypothetical protein
VDEIETIWNDTIVCTDDETKIGKPRWRLFKATKPSAIEQDVSPLNGSSVCMPYKIEKLEQDVFGNDPGSGRRTAIIETLRQSTIHHETSLPLLFVALLKFADLLHVLPGGVKVFIVDSKSTDNAQDLCSTFAVWWATGMWRGKNTRVPSDFSAAYSIKTIEVDYLTWFSRNTPLVPLPNGWSTWIHVRVVKP